MNGVKIRRFAFASSVMLIAGPAPFECHDAARFVSQTLQPFISIVAGALVEPRFALHTFHRVSPVG